MARLTSITDIDGDREEGKLLIMALAIISTTYYQDLEPDSILGELYSLSDKVDEIDIINEKGEIE